MNNPGTTKQGVVNNNKSGYSRNPVLRTIKNLEKKKILFVRKDEHNSQVHHLFITTNLFVLPFEELIPEYNELELKEIIPKYKQLEDIINVLPLR